VGADHVPGHRRCWRGIPDGEPGADRALRHGAAHRHPVTGSVTGNDIKRAANGASWRVPTVGYTLDGHEYDARLANYTSNAGLPEGTAIPLAVAPKDPYRPVAVELSSWPTVYWYLIPIGLGALGALCVGIR
jgi:hypothetical protein